MTFSTNRNAARTGTHAITIIRDGVSTTFNLTLNITVPVVYRTVTFMTGHGANAVHATRTVPSGQSLSGAGQAMPANPTRAGNWAFNGWSPSFSGTTVVNTDMTVTATWLDTTPPSTAPQLDLYEYRFFWSGHTEITPANVAGSRVLNVTHQRRRRPNGTWTETNIPGTLEMIGASNTLCNRDVTAAAPFTTLGSSNLSLTMNWVAMPQFTGYVYDTGDASSGQLVRNNLTCGFNLRFTHTDGTVTTLQTWVHLWQFWTP